MRFWAPALTLALGTTGTLAGGGVWAKPSAPDSKHAARQRQLRFALICNRSVVEKIGNVVRCSVRR